MLMKLNPRKTIQMSKLKENKCEAGHLKNLEENSVIIFNQEKEFLLHKRKMNYLIVNNVNENIHKKIKLGETSKKFFKSPVEYCLESFPVSIVGCCGAGKTTDLLT